MSTVDDLMMLADNYRRDAWTFQDLRAALEAALRAEYERGRRQGITDVHDATRREQEIDTGDHVRHRPSGEEWLVAYVRNGRLVCCGWPETVAALSDCMLTKKASPVERYELLLQMAKSDGSRASYAKDRLSIIAESSLREQDAEPAAWRPAFKFTNPTMEAGRTWSGGKPSKADIVYWTKNGIGIEYAYSSPPRRRPLSFDAAWAMKEAEGYRYGEHELENVRLGWELCERAHGIGDE